MSSNARHARNPSGAACVPRKRSASRATRVTRGLALYGCLLVLLCFVLFPVRAFADWTNSTTVSRGTDAVNGDSYIVVTGKPCNSEYYAAARACGYSDGEISRFTADEKAYASNPATGGRFYVLANEFVRDSDANFFTQALRMFLDGLERLFGVAVYDSVWTYKPVNSELLAGARADLAAILRGEVSGGGDTQEVYTFTGGTYFRATTPKHAFLSGDLLRYYVASKTEVQNGTVAMASTDLVVNVPKSCAPNFFAEYGTPAYDLVLSINCSAAGVFQTFQIIAFPMGHIDWQTSANTVYTTSPYYSRYDLGETLTGRSLSLSVGSRYEYSGNTINVLTSVVDNGTGSGYGTSGAGPNAGSILLSGGVHQGPTLPPPTTNWPDPDPTPDPDPPEVPEPGDDPVVAPEPPDLPEPGNDPVVDPYTPDPDPPANPVITYDPNPTGDATDYRPWLNAILVLLRKINTTISDGFGDLRGYLTNHCDHIREQIHDDTVALGLKVSSSVNNGFVGFERWLQGTWTGYLVDQFDYVMGQQFQELEDYLYDLFHWLAGQFDFSFGGDVYDDSSVIYWLRQIYSRLGGAAPNPGTGDNPDDGFDWWAWLLGLITDALGGIITDFVGDVGGFLATLADVFPFSIPGDIVAYLTLLDAARETPRFVVTIPAIQGWWPSYDYEIDLSPFDDAMGVVRGMFLIYWGLVLAMKTDWLGGVFDFASRAVVQFFDKITGGAYSA